MKSGKEKYKKKGTGGEKTKGWQVDVKNGRDRNLRRKGLLESVGTKGKKF